MEQKLYHGSKVAGLKELKPFESTQLGSYVYATPYEEVAVIFGFRPGSLLLGIGMEKTEDGKDIFTICERKPNVLKQYCETPISVYEVEPEKFENFTEHNWANAEVRAKDSQKIIKETVIDDVYLKLQELEQQGKIKIYHHPDKTRYMAPDNSDLVPMAFRLYYMGGRNDKRINQFGKLYPEFSELCNTILEKTKNYNDNELVTFIENMYDPQEKKLNEQLIFSKKL